MHHCSTVPHPLLLSVLFVWWLIQNNCHNTHFTETMLIHFRSFLYLFSIHSIPPHFLVISLRIKSLTVQIALGRSAKKWWFYLSLVNTLLSPLSSPSQSSPFYRVIRLWSPFLPFDSRILRVEKRDKLRWRRKRGRMQAWVNIENIFLQSYTTLA